MTAILAAMTPVFLAILTGWGARYFRMVPEAAWGGVNRLTYMVLSPVYMFTEIVKADLVFEDLSYVLAGLAGFTLTAAAAFALLPLARGDRASFASAHQGAVRWNTFIILAASASLLGDKATALVALIMGPAIPLVNIVTVSVHSRWGDGQNPTLAGILRGLATNPLIIACVGGLVVNLSGVDLPKPATDTLSIVGRGALGVSLMCVGAGLDIAAITARPTLMAAAVAMKLLVAPAIFISMGLLAGLDGVWLACLAMLGTAPSPPAAYVLTREMGGNPRFMAGHITATTLLAMIAIPTAIAIAQWLRP